MADNTNNQPQSISASSSPKQTAPKPAAATAKQAPVKTAAHPPKTAPKKTSNASAAAPKKSAANRTIQQPAPDKSCGGRWRKLSGCGKFNLILYLFLLSPFILEGSIWLLILGSLIPIGFGFGVIKHRVPILWFIILVIVNIGGLADLTADVWLLLRTIFYYVTDYKVNPFGNMTEEEFNLILIRMIVTLVTGVPSIIFLFFMNSEAWVVFTGQKKSNVANGGSGVTALCLMVIWKLAMIFARVTIFWQIFKSLIKHKKITEETEKNTKFWEIAATLEVLWSAIPLGILTALEAFYFEDISHVTPTKVWELIKLGALAIDLIGVSYFVYFEIFGMNKIVHKCLGEHDHHEPSINRDSDERSPLIVEHSIVDNEATVIPIE